MSDYPFFHGATPAKFRKARSLRLTMTEAEKYLWKHIRRNQLDGLRFRRQHPAGRYILDFYCHDAKLAVEADGLYHQQPEQQIYDKQRDKDIESMGIKIIHFTNEEIFKKINDVLKRITECAKSKRS